MKSYTRRTFLKLCSFITPVLVIFSKVPILHKPAPMPKFITLPPENEYPKPLFSFGNNSDLGWYRVGDGKLSFSFGDSGTDIGGKTSDHLSFKAGGSHSLNIINKREVK